MQGTELAKHQRTPACDIKPKRHAHPYIVGTNGYHRCTCQSRRYLINVGGVLPPSVNCEKCGRENATATAFERGLAAGRRQTAVTSTLERATEGLPSIIAAGASIGTQLTWITMLGAGLTPDEAWVALRRNFTESGAQHWIDDLAATTAGQGALARERAAWAQIGFPPPWDMVTG
jgi:hypothetical protein